MARHAHWLSASRSAGAFESWYRASLMLLALLASPATQRFPARSPSSPPPHAGLARPTSAFCYGFVGRGAAARLDGAAVGLAPVLAQRAPAPANAFAAWLAHRNKVNVIGINLCRYNDDDRRDAGRVIRTLAFQIATRLTDYRRLLLDRFESRTPTARK